MMLLSRLILFAVLGDVYGGWYNSTFVAIGDHPYVVAVEDDVKNVICTGTILSDRSVLITGNCAKRIMRNHFEVSIRAGSSYTGKEGTEHHVHNRIVTYREDNFRHNIVVLCTDPIMNLDGKTRKAIPMVTNDKNFCGCRAKVIGWRRGTIGSSAKLASVNVKIINEKRCKGNFPHFVNSEEICVKNLKEGEPLEESYDGAPLVAEGKLFGIVNQHSSFGDENIDSYYRIAHFSDWISQALEECHGSGPYYSSKIEDFPYVVAIQDRDDSVLCTGTILSVQSILVTGYCAHLIIRKRYHVKIRAGSTYTGNGGSKHTTDRILTYKKEGYDHNIGIVCLNRQLDLDGITRRSISLINQNERVLSGYNATVVGWGDSDYGFPNRIRAFDVKILPQQFCKTSYVDFTDSQEICAQNLDENGQAACEGDNGAPVVAADGRLYGIINHYSRICSGVYPDIVYNVAYFSNWIRSTLDSCDVPCRQSVSSRNSKLEQFCFEP
ncbi:hypothetical protein QAD02_009236 [Eretmocerus hayati]|uniref:Uncharacterized protein n=1 Tax=Eretmocerus hayati TaxID=131215 RepID=A0ACC2N9G2_9HYME|nr:hypothetical protein QAD02_009236 [Eretmocerus hayati]